MSGLNRIANAFEQAKKENRPALMPYHTLGYPDQETSLDVICAIADAGADLIELGVPFSDPLADGPSIQSSTQVALEQGMSVARCMEMVKELRTRGIKQPLIMMGYMNPILSYGCKRYVSDAVAAEADGLIVPDLPPEEAVCLEPSCKSYEMALIYMLSPASSPERIKQIAQRTTGFLYLVSLAGVTGARKELAVGLSDFTARAKAAAHTPTAVGFGISTPQQVRAVGEMADGVIVGSALTDAVRKGSDPVKAAGDFVRWLRG
ncbi:MAG: tryptophan synthase subunit alpha [Anaerolineaceae bacterium]|nr:tryptophan synthase subunit alpha [Anaerolineaceae bacterium]